MFVKNNPFAGTDKPALLRFLLSMIFLKSVIEILSKPTSIRVPTIALTIFLKNRFAEIVNVNSLPFWIQNASKMVQLNV